MRIGGIHHLPEEGKYGCELRKLSNRLEDLVVPPQDTGPAPENMDLGAWPLENLANNSSAPLRRRSRWTRKRAIWRATSLPRVAYCGRVAAANSTGIRPRRSEGVAGYAGLQSCGSVWGCPTCSARILFHRALEIGAVLSQALTEGYGLGFMTFTAQHHAGHPLAASLEAVQASWGNVTSGRPWQRLQQHIEGFVRTTEIGIGANGWHPHAHIAMVLNRSGVENFEQIGATMYQRWDASLRRHGYSSLRAGQDWHLVDGPNAGVEVGAYLAKVCDGSELGLGIGLELTHSLAGRSVGVAATVPYWSLVDHLAATGETEALRLIHEYEKATHGRRQVGWSKGLRERFAPDIEVMSDQQIVDTEIGTSDDEYYEITPEGWAKLVQLDCPQVSPDIPAGPAPVVLLEFIEAYGLGASTGLLDVWNIPYRIVKLEA